MPQAARWKRSGTRLAKRKSSTGFLARPGPPGAAPPPLRRSLRPAARLSPDRLLGGAVEVELGFVLAVLGLDDGEERHQPLLHQLVADGGGAVGRRGHDPGLADGLVERL